MTAADKLEPGWYWVRIEPQDGWLPCELGDHGWMPPAFAWPYRLDPAIIGPRLTPPGEG